MDEDAKVEKPLNIENNIESTPNKEQDKVILGALRQIDIIKAEITTDISSEIDIATQEQSESGRNEDIIVALKSLGQQLEIASSEALEQVEVISEMHDLYYSLSNARTLRNINLNTLSNQTKLLRESDKNFDSIKDSLAKTANGNKKEMAATVTEMVRDGRINTEVSTAEQLAFIFSALKDGSRFEEMINLYESSSSQHFVQSTKIREFLAVAYHKMGEKKLKEGNLEEAEMLLTKSETVLDGLVGQGAGNGEVFAIKAKIYKLKSGMPASAESTDGKNTSLQKCIEMSEQGYLSGFEFYPGINLVYNKITQSSGVNNAEELQKSLKITELVYLSTQKAGGIQSNDFWTVTTMLESSVLQGKQDERLLDRVLDLAQVDWEINAPIENLNRLKTQLNQFSSLGNSDELIKNIDWATEKLEERKEQLRANGDRAKNNENKEKNSSSDEILKNGFSYGEIASFSGGNINYGGQLHDHVVNRWDVDVTKKLLNHLGLSDIDDFNQFNEVIDGVIRNKYGTKPLEDLLSSEHKEFDAFMKNFNGVMSAGKHTDSRTNVMVDFYLGKGDCRQHAYTKQLFFDVWKIGRINNYLKSAYEALNENNQKQYEEATAKAKELTNLQMMVFDSTIKSEIKIDGKYSPARNASGELMKSDKVEEIEDHTWNGLAKLNDDGTIKEFFMTDSFYQNEYQFGGAQSTDKEGKMVNGVVIEDFSNFGNKDKGFRCGYIEVVNDSGEKEQIEVRMIPAVYAGNRDNRMKSFSDDLGLPQMRGLIVDSDVDINNFFSDETKADINAMVKKVIDRTLEQPK